MGKRLILVLALLFVVGIAVSAYAEVQNVKVSGDILMEGVVRDQLNLRKTNSATPAVGGTSYDKDLSTFLSHVRVRVDADLTDNVVATVRLLNERAWTTEDDAGSTSSSNNAVAIDLAYATLKEFLYSPLSVTVGRQELHYGNDLIIGDIDTNNYAAGHTGDNFLPRSMDDLSLRKSFDAIKAVLNYDPLVVDLVYSRVSKSVDVKNAVNLYGVNANYAVDKNTTLEGYWWLKKRDRANATTQLSRTDYVNTIGARAQNTSIKDLTLGLELAYQFGTKVNNTTLYTSDLANSDDTNKRAAYAIQFTSSYNLTDLAKKVSDRAANMNPVIGFSYTMLTGEEYKGPSNKKYYRGWDAMYENQAGGTLFNKILGYTNCHVFNVKASGKLMDDLKLGFDWYYLRFYQGLEKTAAGVVPNAVNLTGIAGDPTYAMNIDKDSLGNEFDVNLTYDYTEDVQLGLNGAWFVPGDAFSKNPETGGNNRRTATQIIGSMKVTF